MNVFPLVKSDVSFMDGLDIGVELYATHSTVGKIVFLSDLDAFLARFCFHVAVDGASVQKWQQHIRTHIAEHVVYVYVHNVWYLVFCGPLYFSC